MECNAWPLSWVGEVEKPVCVCQQWSSFIFAAEQSDEVAAYKPALLMFFQLVHKTSCFYPFALNRAQVSFCINFFRCLWICWLTLSQHGKHEFTSLILLLCLMSFKTCIGSTFFFCSWQWERMFLTLCEPEESSCMLQALCGAPSYLFSSFCLCLCSLDICLQASLGFH